MTRPRKKMTIDEKKAKRREQKKFTMRKLREKMKNNPSALEEERRKARERYYKRKEKGLVKNISEMTRREQKAVRKDWRERALRYRHRLKLAKNAEKIVRENTPPSSVNEVVTNSPSTSRASTDLIINSPSTSRVSSGKKVALRNRKKLKLENEYLRNRLKELERKMTKYRMRDQRRHQKNLEENQGRLEEVKKNICDEKKEKIMRIKSKIFAFYLEDSSSRLTAGKKETMTRNKNKKQIRYLNDTIQNLHKTFMEQSGIKVSYTFFCQCRPFWVVNPTEKSRNTCLCATHSNMTNLVKAMRNTNMIEFNSPNDLVTSICCPGKKEKCLERSCSNCQNIQVKYKEFDASEEIMYERWITKKEKIFIKGTEKLCQKTVKENIKITKLEAVKLLDEKLTPFMKHIANINHQYRVIQQIKSEMTDTEALIHIDFSENYCCKYGEEVQSAHFGGSKQQITLHTVVLYTRNNEQLQTDSICTISENLSHDSISVCAHLKPVFDLIKEKVNNLDTLHILSDGAGNQYRNKKMFQLVVTYIFPQLNISNIIWHYNEAGHGKGAPDGVGGCLKRTADRAAALGKDVNDFQKLVSYLSDNCSGIKIIPIDDGNLTEIIQGVRGSVIKPFKGTLSVHQITWNSKTPNLLRFRRLSCASCLPENYCKHYELGTVVVPESILAIARGLPEASAAGSPSLSETLQHEDLDTALDSDVASATGSPSKILQREDRDIALDSDVASAAGLSSPSKTSQRDDLDTQLDSDVSSVAGSPSPSETLQHEDLERDLDAASIAGSPSPSETSEQEYLDIAMDSDTAIAAGSLSPSETSREDLDTELDSEAVSGAGSPSPYETSQREDLDTALDSHATSEAGSPLSSETSQREDPDTVLDSHTASAAGLPLSKTMKSSDKLRTRRYFSTDSIDTWYAAAPHARKTKIVNDFFSDSDSD